MPDTVTVNRDALECLVAVASSAGEDLATGLDDGTYEDNNLAGYTVEQIDAAIEHVGTVLNV